jgi:hypothetical protein
MTGIISTEQVQQEKLSLAHPRKYNGLFLRYLAMEILVKDIGKRLGLPMFSILCVSIQWSVART